MNRPFVTVPSRTYRLLDPATKLGGVGLVAVGLEVGGATAPGLALGAFGAALGLSTVFVEAATSDRGTGDRGTNDRETSAREAGDRETDSRETSDHETGDDDTADE